MNPEYDENDEDGLMYEHDKPLKDKIEKLCQEYNRLSSDSKIPMNKYDYSKLGPLYLWKVVALSNENLPPMVHSIDEEYWYLDAYEEQNDLEQMQKDTVAIYGL